MRARASLATLVSIVLLTQAVSVPPARAAETDVANVEDAPADPPAPSLSIVSPPNVLDAAARLARPALAGFGEGARPLLSPSPAPIMSSNAKTVLIVAIVVGAALILVGVIAVGKPFKKP